jgi:hypothetical protein
MSESGIRSRDAIPLRLADYLALVDWTGRVIRHDKPGVIPSDVRPVLQTLGVLEENWVANTQHFGQRFYRALGPVNRLRRLAERTGQQWVHGLTQAQAFYQ